MRPRRRWWPSGFRNDARTKSEAGLPPACQWEACCAAIFAGEQGTLQRREVLARQDAAIHAGRQMRRDLTLRSGLAPRPLTALKLRATLKA